MTRQQKAALVARLDALEAQLFDAYRALGRARLDLQHEWGVLPGDAKKAPEKVRGEE